MGDLKVGESFEDRVYIVDSSGAAKTGLAPTCTIIDESGNRTAGTVAEMASGWYKVTDFTPDAAGTWCLEWAVAGAYVVQYPNKLFKVGGGTLTDIESKLTWKQQFPVETVQANPVIDTWYTLLDTSEDIRLIITSFYVATTGENLQVRLTMNGELFTGNAAACAPDTRFFMAFSGYNGLPEITGTDFMPYKPFIVENTGLKVEIRKTTANGTGNLIGLVSYATR